MSKPLGPNPLAHILSRQVGTSRYDFRSNLFRERLKFAKNLYKKNLVAHYGCVNAIEFSKEGELLVSGGDDRRVLLWHVEKSIAEKEQPHVMEKQHLSNIFCLGFNSDNSRVFSGSNDNTMIVHDTKTNDAVDVFMHEKAVYGLSVDPMNDQIISTAGEDGRVLIFDLRISEVMCIAKYRTSFHAVMFHPMDGGFIITANAEEGAGLWDLRQPKSPVIRYGGEDAAQNCMSVRFNTQGNLILALRRRLPPILYSTTSETPICQFYHQDYYNSCTMKSCCFAGENDEYVLSGSDNFNLYAWRVDDADCNKTQQWVETKHAVLKGHRSIVNQVRYNPQKCLIASSGVEKIIKLWSPFELEGWTGGLAEEPIATENQRRIYSHAEYLVLMNISIQNMTHDYANQNTDEDQRMLAFFDSLVQQEIEGWSSAASSDSDQSTEHSSDNSSHDPTSLQSSDSDTIIQHVYNRRGRHLNKPHSSKYPNRIAYLIATIRNRLKRLAMKGACGATRMKSSSKFGRKTRRMNLRNNRKMGGKRCGRKKSSKRHSSREPTSDSEVPTKKSTGTKRRSNQHLTTASHNHRSYRYRKVKPLNNNNNQVVFNRQTSYNNPTISSSDDDDTIPKISGGTYIGQISGGNTENGNPNIAVPSTSTGLTESGSVFRFRFSQPASNEIDSDDDQSMNNSPSYGNTRNYSSDQPVNGNKVSNNQRTNNNDIYSSHSNSRLSNSELDDDDDTSNDSLREYFLKRKRLCGNGHSGGGNGGGGGDGGGGGGSEVGHSGLNTTLGDRITEEEPSNDSDNNLMNSTPQKNIKVNNQTPDSGIASSAACSSSGSVIGNGRAATIIASTATSNGGAGHVTPITADPHGPNAVERNASLKIFNQKISRVRRSYRKKFGDDSDSD